jgi:hypothetical protein
MIDRNLVNYRKQAYMKKALFIYLGTAALKRGHGMCFDMDYVTTTTGETATDPFGARGLKVVEVPKNSNNGAFAGVLTRDYPARASGVQMVELWLPGGCAMVAQRVASTINAGLLTCAVCENDSAVTTLLNGTFGHGGFPGRGSAIPLETLAAATLGDLALQNIAGTAVSVYSAATGLTTITLAGLGTACGYVSAAVAADDYELNVFGGATAADSTTERCPSGVYPVVQATGANTITVTGDTGDGALTITVTKKNLMRLAYLMDGRESGLVDYFLPETGAVRTPILDSGMSIVLGGLTMAADCEPVVNDGTIPGQRKGFYMLATVVTKEVLLNITSAMDMAEGTLSTIEMNTAGEWATFEWLNFGPNAAANGTWQLTGIAPNTVAVA